MSIVPINSRKYGLYGRSPFVKFRRRYVPKGVFRFYKTKVYRSFNTNKTNIYKNFGRFHLDLLNLPTNTQKANMANRDVAYSVNAYDSSDIFGADSLQFINQIGDTSVYSMRYRYTTHDSLMVIVRDIENALFVSTDYSVRYEFHGQNTVYVILYSKRLAKNLVMVRIDDYLDCCDPIEVADRDIQVVVQGEPMLAVGFCRKFVELKREVKFCKVEWKFQAGGRTQTKMIRLEKPNTPKTEFYPWLPCDIETYIDNYLASSSNILVLLGPPGTGKTSFIRYLVHSRNMSSILTYDEGLLGSDSLFVDYLTDDDQNMLLIEDADVLLTDRENAGNKVMSKLLNVSDGMIKVFNKKMVFTANVGHIDDIDPAILRPGRAFDVMMFRELSFDEACTAADAAGVPRPTEERKYTLAEVFNAEEVASVSRNVEQARKISFGFTSK